MVFVFFMPLFSDSVFIILFIDIFYSVFFPLFTDVFCIHASVQEHVTVCTTPRGWTVKPVTRGSSVMLCMQKIAPRKVSPSFLPFTFCFLLKSLIQEIVGWKVRHSVFLSDSMDSVLVDQVFTVAIHTSKLLSFSFFLYSALSSGRTRGSLLISTPLLLFIIINFWRHEECSV